MMCVLFDESDAMSILSEFGLRLVERPDEAALYRVTQSQQGNPRIQKFVARAKQGK